MSEAAVSSDSAPAPEPVDLSTLSSADLRALLQEKQRQMGVWESEVAHAVNVLRTQGNIGMHTSLIDAEGFPRDDIDVTAVRHARNTVAMRTNDLKAIGDELKGLLELVFAAAAREQGIAPPEAHNDAKAAQRRESKQQQQQQRDDAAGGSSAASLVARTRQLEVDLAARLAARWAPHFAPPARKGIAVFRDIAAGGPAALAGLAEGDVVVAAGSDTGEDLTPEAATVVAGGGGGSGGGATVADLAAAIKRHEGAPLRLVLARSTAPGGRQQVASQQHVALCELVLVPRVWSGNGILGCGVESV